MINLVVGPMPITCINLAPNPQHSSWHIVCAQSILGVEEGKEVSKGTEVGKPKGGLRKHEELEQVKQRSV